MADLRTNYKDDVLDTSVNDKRKYQMIQNADGTVSFNDVTTYTQNGDTYGSKDVNETNEKVNELNSNLKFPDGTGFYPDEKDGVKGYNTSSDRGADTFFPFNGNTELDLKFNQIVYQNAQFTQNISVGLNTITSMNITPTNNGNMNTVNFTNGDLQLYFQRGNSGNETTISNVSFSDIKSGMKEKTVVSDFNSIPTGNSQYSIPFPSDFNEIHGIKELLMTHANTSHTLLRGIILNESSLDIYTGRPNSGTDNMTVSVTFIGK